MLHLMPHFFDAPPEEVVRRVETHRTLRKLSDKQLSDVHHRLEKKRRVGEGGGHFLRCRSCSHIITGTDRKIEIAGQHAHTFRNPAGILYHIGCFSSAPGCFIFGEPTTEYTWFPGYSWSYANCARCFMHLGWLFQSGADRFYGLILSHLAEDKPKDPGNGGAG